MDKQLHGNTALEYVKESVRSLGTGTTTALAVGLLIDVIEKGFERIAGAVELGFEDIRGEIDILRRNYERKETRFE